MTTSPTSPELTISKLHSNTSIIITTNLMFSEWPQVFGCNKMTAALLDRICHNWGLLRDKDSMNF
ncbi:ATP-binding protein [Candidatus Tisiphia endosymbiont of Sialis lutaria]|uniref:ATP-binding protein n=1 Tax=Candidatus Tisiphia endosymbiont of Sialis lutaria TaxID=2029164 RepID=UPI003977B290